MPDRRREIVLCADDYGLSPGVSRAIRELLQQGRLSATSCMVVFPEFPAEGPLLRPFFGQADIGLHVTLTADRPLREVLIEGWLRRLDTAAMTREVERQVEVFTAVMGREPDYLDSHQHVHLLAGVRDAVVAAAKRIGAYVRLTREPIDAAMLRRPAPVDSAYLSWASRPLARLAEEADLRTNSGYRGTRSFKERVPFRDLFRRMIADASNGTIVCCHPGMVDATLALRDPIHQQREEEFAYLSGEDFPRDLDAAELSLARLSEALG
jgi:hypothetical protein